MSARGRTRVCHDCRPLAPSLQRARALRAQGFTVDEIAAAEQTSRQAVHARFNEMRRRGVLVDRAA